MGDKMRRHVIKSVAALILSLMIAGSANGLTNFIGLKEFSAKTEKGGIFKVKIHIARVSKDLLTLQGWRWGTEDKPKTVIKKIEAIWESKKVYIPLSAYFDLANPNEASLTNVGNKLHFHVKGGDAATSYTAVLIFENGFIRSRKVMHGEFPDEAWEETRYSFNELDI